ncbi:MAG: ATP-dependent DNA helicase [bacterium]|nr:ATP-dependent DNA helicase [bacterium]
MSDTVFNSLYKKLNWEQKKAVDAIEGPVMVIAGPGTGKTSILTLRIANILRKTDTPPSSILALTFTESGVYSMRKKLVEIIGAAGYRVAIFTFHGFAMEVIRRFPESFPRIIGGRPATVPDQVEILESIFLKKRFKRLSPFGDILHYVPKALRAIRELKRENMSPAVLQKTLEKELRELKRIPSRMHTSGRFKGEVKGEFRERENRLNKSLELAQVYEAYEKELAARQLFDFEDMILFCIKALEKDKGLLLSLQEQYLYLLADEHQDANNAQNRILELLASFHENPNLFIVGDEKQAIYRFQGASLDNFLYFKKLYTDALPIELKDNYRSPQMLLDAAHSLINATNPLPLFKGENKRGGLTQSQLRPRLLGKRPGGKETVRFFEFSNQEAEIAFVIHEAKRLVKSGVPLREIAILLRDNADAVPFIEAFERTDIPFTVLTDEDILQDEELRKLLLILEASTNAGNPELFAQMLHLELFHIDPVSLYRVLRFCHTNRHSLFEVLQSPRLLRQAKVDGEALRKAYAQFLGFARAAQNLGAAEAIELIARESGFVPHLLQTRGSLRALQKLDTFFGHLKELSMHRRSFSLADFLETLQKLRRHNLRLRTKDNRPQFYESLSIMTAHRAKGLEFEYVFICGATDGHWGGRRTKRDFYIPIPLTKGGGPKGRGLLSPLIKGASRRPGVVTTLPHKNASAPFDKGDNEDERRLFFVSLTRARVAATITMSKEGADGRPLLPTEFIEDIGRKFLTRESALSFEATVKKLPPRYATARRNTGPSVTLQEYLRKVFLEQGLTVTALNNYLACPWEYFFKNLVRLPQLPEAYLSYGTAMHAALHSFFDAYRENKRLGKPALLRFFLREMERSPLPLRDFKRYSEKGKAALSAYFDAYAKTFAQDTQNELEITGVFLPLDVGLSFPRKRESRADSSKKLDSRLRGNDISVPLLLRGVIDKLEQNSDGGVTVVDYKTGKPKSRAEILGKTKGSNGNIIRQLHFYKLLLQGLTLNREKGQTFQMTTGVIDFIEPDARGTLHREVFEVEEREVDKLKVEVQRVGKEIYDFSFWDTRCERRGCEYCRLRQSLN